MLSQSAVIRAKRQAPWVHSVGGLTGLSGKSRCWLDAIMPVIEVDVATHGDADALAATFGAARRAAMPWLPRLHSDGEDRRYFAEHVIGECDVLVVRLERRPVAFLALRNDMVEHLYLRPDFQRAGIGSAMLEVAKSRRPGGLRLWVVQRNHGARAFFRLGAGSVAMQ